MATLHMLSNSPFADDRFASCLRLLGEKDGLLLTGDAVYALQPGSAPANALQALAVPIHALTEDLEARRIVAPESVIAIDYPAFVALCGSYDKVNSWL